MLIQAQTLLLYPESCWDPRFVYRRRWTRGRSMAALSPRSRIRPHTLHLYSEWTCISQICDMARICDDGQWYLRASLAYSNGVTNMTTRWDQMLTCLSIYTLSTEVPKASIVPWVDSPLFHIRCKLFCEHHGSIWPCIAIIFLTRLWPSFLMWLLLWHTFHQHDRLSQKYALLTRKSPLEGLSTQMLTFVRHSNHCSPRNQTVLIHSTRLRKHHCTILYGQSGSANKVERALYNKDFIHRVVYT